VAGSIADAAAVLKAVDGCDVVFHCAYDFAGSRRQQKHVGIQGTRNVSEAVLQHGVSRMVHVSTFAVYAPTPDGDLSESAAWPRSTNAYVLVKRQAERLVSDLWRQRHLPVVTLQPTLVYGPFSEQWTIGLAHKLKTGLIPLVNGGAGYCNAVYIDDVVDALILASTRPGVVGETFLISAEKPVTWREFYGGLEAALNISATIELTDEELATLARANRSQGTLLRQLQALAREPVVRAQLARIPLARRIAALLTTYTSEERWQSLKSRLLGDDSSPRNARAGRKPIHLPSDSLLALYRSRTRVRIDKAQERLGYAPQFDFARGMDLTTRFIHWANLG
jgi:nucleoside-diphosphate-sugar epimerase